MSNAAYNEAGSSPPFSGDLEAPAYEKMVRHLSGSDSTVYHNLDHPDQYTIAYRGSRFERHLASDTGADLAIATGLEGYNPRFRKALATYDALRLEHPRLLSTSQATLLAVGRRCTCRDSAELRPQLLIPAWESTLL